MERFVSQFAIYIDITLSLLESTLKKGCLGRVRSVAVTDACTQAYHTVIETEYRLTGYEIGSEVFQVTFHQLHGKHTVLSFQ